MPYCLFVKLKQLKYSFLLKQLKCGLESQQLTVDQVTCYYVTQACDCWLLAVISGVASIPQLFEHICPIPQIIEGPDYVGVFKFRFWQFGNWVEVLIDDRLPVDSNNRMIFMHSDESNEMWSALMEKAYAK
ncbi:unnamed protein product [Dibothriocephalus latus]|uniref:Calpain catalytic domain-containing protein n=1 Tax=Dibothriocephalus latus TaxID=60516 RepID=A0A3P7NXK8_DIBLA|nr:unnamed protein product [Dibothriocephalus latus]